MTRIEDELRSAADDVRRRVADVDVDAALANVSGTRRGRSRSAPMLLAAAAAVITVAIGAAVALRDHDRRVVADAPTTSTTATTSSTTTSTTTPATSTTTTSTTTTGPPPSTDPEGPSDLIAPTARLEITFDGVHELKLGDPVGSEDVETIGPGDSCGWFGSGSAPAVSWTASPRVTTIVVRNPDYRTASGVGLGTSLASLQRVYGADLVVDRSDGWERPTNGLLASYQDVAAIRHGDRALTFYLRDDVVEAVKVSDAELWGDDEGCA